MDGLRELERRLPAALLVEEVDLEGALRILQDKNGDEPALFCITVLVY